MMNCKHGKNTHRDVLAWADCVLGDDFIHHISIYYDYRGKHLVRYYYKNKEYSLEQIQKICELKAFL